MTHTYRILGAGEWGIAVGHHLARLGSKVEIYGRKGKTFDRFKESRLLEKLNLTLHHNVSHIDQLSSLRDFENDCINIISTSSTGFFDLVRSKKNYLKLFDEVVWLTKGLDKKTGKFFDEIITKEIDADTSLCVVSGPSFAVDLVNKKSQTVSIAGTDKELLTKVKKVWQESLQG